MAQDRIKIVCIEDQQDVIELIKVILPKNRYEVVGVIGGDTAAESVRMARPDLVLLDLMMPGVDGWAVYKQLRSHPQTAHIPVVAVTAKAQAIDEFFGREIARFDGYITKPFSPNELLSGVSQVLEMAG